MTKKVLLPLDGSEASKIALIPAKSIAELLGLTLCILHVTDEKLSREEVLVKLGLQAGDLGRFVVVQHSGSPEKAILKEAENSSYIIMGTHGQTCDETLRMGSTALKVIENTDKPVLLIKPNACLNLKGTKWTLCKALIPINGAPKSSQALAPAMEVLAKTTAEIELLHIFPEKCEPIAEEGGFSAPYYEDYPQHEWPSWSKEFLRRFCPIMENHNNIKMNVLTAKGDPADEIISIAEKKHNDFIAIAWHGTMSKFRALTLKKILSESNCPIMLIKIKD